MADHAKLILASLILANATCLRARAYREHQRGFESLLKYSENQEGTIMRTYDKFYINGQWVEPIGKGTSEVINPATGEISASVPYGNAEDVDAAVNAARNAFDSWSQTSAAERADFLRKLAAEGEKRNADLTQTIIDEL